MRKRRHTIEQPPAIELSADDKLAHIVCLSIYTKGCVCRDRGRGEVCENMRRTARNARAQIEKETPIVGRLRDALVDARGELVIAIGFLNRDAGKTRSTATALSLVKRFSDADKRILEVLGIAKDPA